MLAIDTAAANAVELFPSDGIVLVNMMTRTLLPQNWRFVRSVLIAS